MKKINSIDYGGEVILFGSILAFVIPLAVKFCPIKVPWLKVFALTSAILGGLILFVFFIILLIEWHQDKKIAAYYEQYQNTKLKIGEGKYECQSCGNRALSKDSKTCSVCGIKFKE